MELKPKILPLKATSKISKDFIFIDTNFKSAQFIAKHLTKNSPPRIPSISPTSEEILQFAILETQIADLEQHIKKIYGAELRNIDFHGRLSHQRLVWQDEEFIKLIQDPMIVKALFYRAQNCKEQKLDEESGYTLSSMVLYGLASNRLSYLISATPNRLPKGIHPPELTQDFLQSITKGFTAVQNVLNQLIPISTIPIEPQELQQIEEQIVNASFKQLLNAITCYVKDKARAEELAKGASLATGLESMNLQCLQPMDDYEVHADNDDVGHAKVLRFTLYSHTLDPRHLIAAIWSLTSAQPVSEEYQSKQKSLIKLLKGAQDGSIGDEATLIMKIKLQQILTIIVDKCTAKKTGVTIEEVSKALNDDFRDVEASPPN
jgi:hypothetical protein